MNEVLVQNLSGLIQLDQVNNERQDLRWGYGQSWCWQITHAQGSVVVVQKLTAPRTVGSQGQLTFSLVKPMARAINFSNRYTRKANKEDIKAAMPAAVEKDAVKEALLEIFIEMPTFKVLR